LAVKLVNFFRRVIKFNYDSIAIAVDQVFIELVEEHQEQMNLFGCLSQPNQAVLGQYCQY
jgi:hypothetical protein